MPDALSFEDSSEAVLCGFPLSPHQRHLWALEQGLLESPYTAWCKVAIEGNIEVGAIEAAVATVVSRHEILRTTFHRLPELVLPLQVVDEDGGLIERTLDLSGWAPEEREATLAELTGRLSHCSIVRDVGPLLRLFLAILSHDRALLLVGLPALCADVVGLRNFVREIAQAYRLPSGEILPEVLQYPDLTEWLNGRLGEEDSDTERRRWHQARAAGAEVRLPFRFQSLSEPAFVPRSLLVEAPDSLIAGLAANAAEGPPLPVLLLACWQALLSRLTQCSTLTIGALFDGRTYEGLEESLGLFARFLPIRLEIEGATPLAEAFARADAALREAYEIQEYLDWQSSEYCAFGFEFDEATTSYPARDCSFSIVEQHACSDRFEVKLYCLADAGSLRLEMHYDAALYDTSDIERLARHYCIWIDRALADPGICAHDVDLLTESERRQILACLTGAAPQALGADGIHHLFEQQVQRTPQAPAVVCTGRQLTYAELDSRANRLANRLRRQGVGPDTLVALFMGRSADLLVGMLGTLKAGGAFVPLDPLQPKNRIALMLDDLGGLVLLTEKILARELDPGPAKVICLDAEWEAIAEESDKDPAVAVSGQNLVYVIFTSGSTGRPKGVAVEHRQLLSYTSSIINLLDLPAGASFATVSTFAADLGHTMIFSSLCTGGCLHVLDEERVSDGERLGEYFASHQIDCLKIVPSHLEALLAGTSRPELLLPRRRLVLGGEGCRRVLIERLIELRPACRIFNHYGPTETTVGVLAYALPEAQGATSATPSVLPLGRPLVGTRAYVLDGRRRPCPLWVAGELYIGGANVTRGYLRHPEATALRFSPDPWGPAGERLYRTGDLVRCRPDGMLEFLGRCDDQIKLRGFRIELGEIAAVLESHPRVKQSLLIACEAAGEMRLAAYFVPVGGEISQEDLRGFLRLHLPEYMMPSFFIPLVALPLSPNGKIDRKALPKPENVERKSRQVPPRTEVERLIATIWHELLPVDDVGVEDNFFDLGGHSLLMVRVHAKLREAGFSLVMTDLFSHPTIKALADYLGRAQAAPLLNPQQRLGGSSDIAVIGLAGRFPGADDVEGLWRVLSAGVEAITFLSDEELMRSGISSEVFNDSRYVRARGILNGSDLFDAAFFGYSPREAQLMDPQQRLFLEGAWQTIEDGGYDCSRFPGRIGVFGGTGVDTYFFNILSNPEFIRPVDSYHIRLGNRSDFLTARVSYKLNLKGPSLNVQTGCSTSLVAVCLACDSLRKGECDMALAGGVTITAEQERGYIYEEGGIASPDGHVYAFDARARGTSFGSGMGIVLLKRLQDALADGDSIRAVIKGTALNNDGSAKVGFTAPSSEGQAEVVAQAHAEAGVDPATITYVETHGTGTRLGDPIEIAGLTRAFRAGTEKRSFCAIGSVKTNLGHLDAAAGIAGLIKTVLALEHRQIPPSLNFETPNPEIDFERSPFYVNQRLAEWKVESSPRRAGVSAFGIGGTNAHVVLEEAPERPPAGASRPWQLLALSARTPTALESAVQNLARYLVADSGRCLPDVAYTLAVGRKVFPHRCMLVCRDSEDAAAVLASRDPRRVFGSEVGDIAGGGRPVTFLFSGLGEQYPGMAHGLYREEPAFREPFDRCAELFAEPLGADLRELLFPSEIVREDEGGVGGLNLRSMVRHAATVAPGSLDRTGLLQPTFFAFEYALASMWMKWGIVPESMIGYSLGEYVAACLAGVLSLGDAVRLVAARARLIEALPEGAMLAVPLSEEELVPYLGDDLSLAAVNGERATVASGSPDAIADLARRLDTLGVSSRRLRTTHAFHSFMMEGAAPGLAVAVERLKLNPPRIPYLSNLTGTWVTVEQATDPKSWVEHLLRPVRFSAGVEELWREPGRVLLEIGPGRSLSSLALQHPSAARTDDPVALPSLPSAYERRPDQVYVLETLGKLWLLGSPVDWTCFYNCEQRLRVPLPTYPFERRRYWIERPEGAVPRAIGRPELSASGLYFPAWRRSMPLSPQPASVLAGARWLLFVDAGGLGTALAERLSRAGARVSLVSPGEHFKEIRPGVYEIDPRRGKDCSALLTALEQTGSLPTRIVYAWSMDGGDELLRTGSLLSLVHFFASLSGEQGGLDHANLLAVSRFLIVGRGLTQVTATEPLRTELAPLAALCQTLPLEFPGAIVRAVDVLPEATDGWRGCMIDGLLSELLQINDSPARDIIAYRGSERWVRTFEPIPQEALQEDRVAGTVVLLGRPEGLLLRLGVHLARAGVRLALVIPSGFSLSSENFEMLAVMDRKPLVFTADLDDAPRLTSVLSEIAMKGGGISHVAIGEGLELDLPQLPLSLATRDQAAAAFSAVNDRLTLLSYVLPPYRPGCCLLLATLTVGPRRALSDVVNRIMSSFSEEQTRSGVFPWICVKWELWEEEGEDVVREGAALQHLLSLAVPNVILAPMEPSILDQRRTAMKMPTEVERASTRHARPKLRNTYIPPETEIERDIVVLWQQLLSVEPVGLNDSFFDLGGDSLIGIQVVTQVWRSMGVELSLPALFEFPTPATLAKRIGELASRESIR
jgi:amino acid adenylation domain-containing protein